MSDSEDKFIVCELVSFDAFFLYDVRMLDAGYKGAIMYVFYKKNPLLHPTEERMKTDERRALFAALGKKETINMVILGFVMRVNKAWKQISNPLVTNANDNNSNSNTDDKVSFSVADLSVTKKQEFDKGSDQIPFLLGNHLLTRAKLLANGKKPPRRIQPLSVGPKDNTDSTFVYTPNSASNITIQTKKGNRGTIIIDPTPIDELETVVAKFSDMSVNEVLPAFDSKNFRYDKIKTIKVQIHRAELYLLLCESAHRIRQQPTDTLSDLLPQLAAKHAWCEDIDFLQHNAATFDAYPVKKKIRTYYESLMRLRFFDTFFNSDIVYPALCTSDFEEGIDYFLSPTPIGSKITTSPMTPEHTVLGAYPGLPVSANVYEKHFESLAESDRMFFGYDRCINDIVFMIVNPFTRAAFHPVKDMQLDNTEEPKEIERPERASSFNLAHLMQCESPRLGDDGSIQHPNARLVIGLDGVLYVMTTQPIVFQDSIYLYVSSNIPVSHMVLGEEYTKYANSYSVYLQQEVSALNKKLSEKSLPSYKVFRANAVLYFNTRIYNVFDTAYATPKKTAWLVKCASVDKTTDALTFEHTPCFMYVDSLHEKFKLDQDEVMEFRAKQYENTHTVRIDTRFVPPPTPSKLSELLLTRIEYTNLAAYHALLLDPKNWTEAMRLKISQSISALNPNQKNLATVSNLTTSAQVKHLRDRIMSILESNELAFSQSEFKYEIPNYSSNSSMVHFSTYVSDDDKIVTIARANVNIPQNTVIDFYNAFAWKTEEHTQFLRNNYPSYEKTSRKDILIGDMTFVAQIVPSNDDQADKMEIDNDDQEEDEDEDEDEDETTADIAVRQTVKNGSFQLHGMTNAIRVVDKVSIYSPNVEFAVIPDYIGSGVAKNRRPGELVVFSSRNILKGEELIMLGGEIQRPLMFNYEDRVLVDIAKPENKINCLTPADIIDGYRKMQDSQFYMSTWKWRSLFQPQAFAFEKMDKAGEGNMFRPSRLKIADVDKMTAKNVFVYRDHMPVEMQIEINKHRKIDTSITVNELKRREAIKLKGVDIESQLYKILTAELLNMASDNLIEKSALLSQTTFFGVNDVNAAEIRKRYIMYILENSPRILNDTAFQERVKYTPNILDRLVNDQAIVVNSISTRGVSSTEQDMYRRFFLISLMREMYTYSEDDADVYVALNQINDEQMQRYAVFLTFNYDTTDAVNYVRSDIRMNDALTELLDNQINKDKTSDEFVDAYSDLAVCSLYNSLCEGVFNSTHNIDMSLSKKALEFNSQYIVAWTRAYNSILHEKKRRDEAKPSKKRAAGDDKQSKKRSKTTQSKAIENDDDVDILDDDQPGASTVTAIMHDYGQKSDDDIEMLKIAAETDEYISTANGQALFQKLIADHMNNIRKQINPAAKNIKTIKVQDVIDNIQLLMQKQHKQEYDDESPEIIENMPDSDLANDVDAKEESLRMCSFISRNVQGASDVYADVLYDMVVDKGIENSSHVESIATKHRLSKGVAAFMPSDEVYEWLTTTKNVLFFLFKMDKLHQQRTYFSGSDANFKEVPEYEIPDDSSKYGTYIAEFENNRTRTFTMDKLDEIKTLMTSSESSDDKIKKLTKLQCFPLTVRVMRAVVTLLMPENQIDASEEIFTQRSVLVRWWNRETTKALAPIYDFFAMMWTLYVCDSEALKSEMYEYIDNFIEKQLKVQKEVLLALQNVTSRQNLVIGILLSRQKIEDVEKIITQFEKHYALFFSENLTGERRKDWMQDKQAYLEKNKPVMDYVINLMIENNIISDSSPHDEQIKYLTIPKVDSFLSKLQKDGPKPVPHKKGVTFNAFEY